MGSFLGFQCPQYTPDSVLRFGNHDRLPHPDDCQSYFTCLRTGGPRLTLGQNIDTFKVVVNEHDVTVDDGQEVLDICSKKEHPSYSSHTNAHDIAILTLCKAVTFPPKVSPICLPEQPGEDYDNLLSTVTGWGTLSLGGAQSDVLMGVNVTTIDNTECDNDYGGGVIQESMICAKAPGKDACQGDSGGPLITKEPGDFYSLI